MVVRALSSVAFLACALTSFSASAAPVGARSSAGRLPTIVALDLATHEQRVLGPVRGDFDLASNGRRIAYITRRGNATSTLWVARLDGSRARALVRVAFPTFLGEPRWAPDGHAIAYVVFEPRCETGIGPCGSEELWLVRTAGGSARKLSDRSFTAAWAADSHRLAFPGELDVTGFARLTVENEDGSGTSVLGDRVEIYSLAWSGDGRRLLYATSTSDLAHNTVGVHVVDVASGADGVVATGILPSWSRDTKFLSFVRGRTLYVQARDRRPRVVLTGAGFTFATAWSRIGHRLAIAATNGVLQARLYVVDLDASGKPRPVTGWRYGPVPFVAWSPNGRRLLFERSNH